MILPDFQQGHQLRPIQTLNFQLHTLIPVAAKFICSQKAKAYKISESLLWCLEYHGSLSYEAPADEEPCWDGLLQRPSLSPAAGRISTGCPAAGFSLGEHLGPLLFAISSSPLHALYGS